MWSYAARNYQYEMGKAHQLFLWNPYMFSGQPFCGAMESALFYPPEWIFFFVPPGRGIVYFVTCHFLLAAICFFLFLRKTGFSPPSALGGAVLFSLGGFPVLNVIHIQIFAAYCLIPPGLLLAQRFLERANLTSALLLGAFTGIHLLAGSPQMTICLAVALFCWIYLSREKRTTLARLTLLLIPAVIVAVSLPAIQLFPTYEYLHETTRSSSISMAEATAHSLRLRDLALWFVPDYQGHPLVGPPFRGDYFYWELCFYVGIFPVMAAMAALFTLPAAEKGRFRAFLVMAITGLFLALGKYLPFYGLLYRLPIFSSFRLPMRYLVLLLLFLSYMVAVALEYLPSRSREAPAGGRKSLAGSIALPVLFFAALSTLLIVQSPYGITKGMTVHLLMGCAALVLIIFSRFRVIPHEKNQLAMFVAVVISCCSFGLTWNPTITEARFRELAASFSGISWKSPPVRVHYYPPYELKETINYPFIEGVSNIVGYSSFCLTRYVEYLIYSDYGKLPGMEVCGRLTAKGNVFGLRNLDTPMIRLLGTSRAFRATVEKGRVSLDGEKLTSSYPRAFLVSHALFEEKSESLLEGLRSGALDPTKVIVLQDGPDRAAHGGEPPAVTNDAAPPGSAEITSFSPDVIEVEISVERPSWLFLGEIFYPGWKAAVDGQSRPVVRADYIFRAVPVYPGERRVKFRYAPESLKKGAMITLVSLILAAGLAGADYFAGLMKRSS
ncbi:MAG: YfhO family protein [Candidatus Eremiobacteraeota bacterium]|nr:YfhO family protein [Candidatus Eremiobacteraeota bacterium]